MQAAKLATGLGCNCLKAACVHAYSHRLQYITLHYCTLHCIILHYIASHCITLRYIALHCITLHYIALHTVTYVQLLHYITVHYNTLHCIFIIHTYIRIYIIIYIIHIYLPCLICFLVPNHSSFVSCIHVVAGKTVDLSGAGASYVTPQPNA